MYTLAEIKAVYKTAVVTKAAIHQAALERVLGLCFSSAESGKNSREITLEHDEETRAYLASELMALGLKIKWHPRSQLDKNATVTISGWAEDEVEQP